VLLAEDATETSPIPSTMIIGRKTLYTVKKGETLRMVGARFGVNWRVIARDNSLDPGKNLKPGQQLRINTTRIIPKAILEGIVINIPERTLYLFKGKKLEKTLPVGLGMKKSRDAALWQTPTGKFRIVSKVKDPTWFVPSSIQSEMRQKGKTVKSVVPPGDRNPLGKYALKTSLAGILIHGTISPDSVYGFNSHGCVRVLPSNMQEIFNEIRVNTGGEIIYQPIKLAASADGRIFLEVHGDIYDRHKNLEEVAKGLITRNNVAQKVDWVKVRSLVKKRSGIPEDVTMQHPVPPLRISMNQSPAGAAIR
jgi:L,D-transpeptidase ErfK/SrfK